MAGNAAGAAKALAARLEKQRRVASAVDSWMAQHPEMNDDSSPEPNVASTTGQNNVANVPETANNVGRPNHTKQSVTPQLLEEASAVAAMTLHRAMTHKRAPWSVRVTAAKEVLTFAGYSADSARAGGPVIDMRPDQLGTLVGAALAEMESRRASSGHSPVIDAEIIPPDQSTHPDNKSG